MNSSIHLFLYGLFIRVTGEVGQKYFNHAVWHHQLNHIPPILIFYVSNYWGSWPVFFMITCIVFQLYVTISHSRSSECIILSLVLANNSRPNKKKSRAAVKCDICIWSLAPSFNIRTKKVSIRPPREYRIRINVRRSIKSEGLQKGQVIFSFKKKN